MQMMTGGGLLLLLGLTVGPVPKFTALAPQSVVAMLFLTIIGSLVGFTCYLWLLGVVSPTRVATYAYVNPIVAVFLGWGFAGERLNLLSVAASFVVLAAVVAIVTSREQVADPRVGLKAGLYDAGEAASGLEKIYSIPKPPGFAPDNFIPITNPPQPPEDPAPGQPARPLRFNTVRPTRIWPSAGIMFL